jgi:hypothetical protein
VRKFRYLATSKRTLRFDVMNANVKQSLCTLLADIALAAAAHNLTNQACSNLLTDVAVSWDMLEHASEQEGLGVVKLHQQALADACWDKSVRRL